MPRAHGRITLALFCATACSPSEFVWSDIPSAELRAYLVSFEIACGHGFDRHAAYDEMLTTIRDSRVVWLGDHHENERLHALQRELLEHLVRRDVRLSLVLEAVGSQDDAVLASYLGGERSLDELRTGIAARWSDSWLDLSSMDAGHYRSLLVFAKQHAIPVFGAEPTPRVRLLQRDDLIASRVRSVAAASPDRTVVVLVGQAHLVGAGDLVARTGIGGVAIGGVPPEMLSAAVRQGDDGGFFRSTGGLWWFGAMFADAR